MLTWLVDLVDKWRQRRVDARLRVHRSRFADRPSSRVVESRRGVRNPYMVTGDIAIGGTIGDVIVTGNTIDPAPRGEAYFLNVQNASPEREITVTHVWIATEPPVHAVARQLPAQIKPGAQWETWIPVNDVPAGTENVERLGRARLGNDTELKSVPRTDVPPVGYVPG
jgi:hypothetical protein